MANGRLLTPLVTVLLAVSVAGCSEGCPEDSTLDVVEVSVPVDVVDRVTTAELRLCQMAGCWSLEAPVASDELEVAFSDFGRDADVDEPGTLQVALSDGADAVLVQDTFDLAFDSRATGLGCGRVMVMSVDLT